MYRTFRLIPGNGAHRLDTCELNLNTLRFGYTFDRYNKTENADGAQGSFGFTNAGAPTGTSTFNQSWANFLLSNVSTFISRALGRSVPYADPAGEVTLRKRQGTFQFAAQAAAAT